MIYEPENPEIRMEVPHIQNPYAENPYEILNNNDGEIICRNCHDTEGDDFIAPCKCSGSIKFVHRKCLDEWRLVSPNPSSFTTCDVCGFNYQMTEISSTEKPCIPPMMKFITLVGFDVGIVLGTWQFLVFGIIIFTALLDMNSERYTLPIMNEIASVNGFLADYLWGNAWFFFCIGTMAIIFGAVVVLLKLCGTSCCAPEKELTAYNYNYHYHGYSSMDWLFFWYIWSFRPIPYGGHYGGSIDCCFFPLIACGDGCDGDLCCHAAAGGFSIGNCFGGSGGGSDGDCGAIVLVILIVVFLVIMLVGVIVGIVLFFMIFASVVKKRIHILDKKTKMSKSMIADMNGKL
eukprot:gene8232-57_t